MSIDLVDQGPTKICENRSSFIGYFKNTFNPQDDFKQFAVPLLFSLNTLLHPLDFQSIQKELLPLIKTAIKINELLKKHKIKQALALYHKMTSSDSTTPEYIDRIHDLIVLKIVSVQAKKSYIRANNFLEKDPLKSNVANEKLLDYLKPKVKKEHSEKLAYRETCLEFVIPITTIALIILSSLINNYSKDF